MKKSIFSMLVLVALTGESNAELKIEGYSPVAYFTEGQAVKGTKDIQSTYKGDTYYFSKQENKELFDENPEKYLPAYNAYCAYGIAKGSKVKIDPKMFTIINDTLYLNYNWFIKRKFDKDPGKYITKANLEWKTLSKE